MNIGIARPGYFTDKKYDPSMQTNWINYDLLCAAICDGYENVSFTTIGFMKNCGADRLLKTTGLGGMDFNPKKFRHKTQQAVTTSILLKDNDDILAGIDLLIMPYYTLFEERCVYYTLAYLAAEREIPTYVWDTDANFIGQVSGACDNFTIEQARDKIFQDPIYVNPDIVDISVIDNLQLRVLSPALFPIHYTIYFPFFHIFPGVYSYVGEKKKCDVVYAGSQYGREELFLKYYNSDLYTVGVCGKYKKSFLEEWAHSDQYYLGHIPRISKDGGIGVQKFLYSGKACIHIAKKSYNRIGHITPRVMEVVDSGTLLLVDASLYGGERIVGKKYVVNGAEDVLQWVECDDRYLYDCCVEQSESDFILDATSERNADIIIEDYNNEFLR